MRILIVNTRHFYGGGDSTYSFNLAGVLARHGHEVAFFAMQDERNIPDPNADLFVSPIDFRELNKHRTVANGVKVLARTIYSTEARRKFAALLDRFSPDMIHLQNFFNHITASIMFEAEQRGLPMVWTLHDYGLACPNAHFLIDRTGEICEACRGGHFYNALFRRCKKDSLLASGMAAFEAYCNRWMRALKKANAFLTPSRFLKDKLVENGFQSEQIHHLPLFVKEENFWDGDGNEGYLLFLGRLEAIKGISVLMEASRLVPRVRILMAGNVGEAFTRELKQGLPTNVEYVGMKRGEELKALVRNALAVIVPSIWYENQPFTILEAFAAGKPVIASDMGGMAELVANRERGLLVKPGDSQALANAMNQIASDRAWAKVMGSNARSYALQTHSPEPHYQGLMGIYDRVRLSPNRA